MSTSASRSPGRRRAAVSAAITGGLCVGAMLGSGATAQAAVHTGQTIDPAPTPVTDGTGVTFSGRLTGLADQPLADKPVELQWRGAPDAPWQKAADGKTDRDGKVAMPGTVTTSSDWRIAYRGDTLHDATASQPRPVESRAPVKPMSQQIVEAAAAQQGKPYATGASGPGSFDCSGLTQFAHKQAGISLPRTSQAQADAVRPIDKAAMQPGDLVFFQDGGQVYHTGVYAGNNKVWAAPDSGSTVKLQDIWTKSYSVGRAW